MKLISGLVGLGCVTLVMADSFAMTLRNNPFSQPEKQAVVAIQESHEQQQEEAALPTKKLRAVIVSDLNPMVNLDGQIITIGEEIDGYKLLSVNEGEAVFQWQGKQHTLTLGNNDLDNSNEATPDKK